MVITQLGLKLINSSGLFRNTPKILAPIRNLRVGKRARLDKHTLT